MQQHEEIEKSVINKIYELAHENNLSVNAFLAKVVEQFHVDIDKVSSMQDKDGEEVRVYNDGKVGIDLDISDQEILLLNRAAAVKDISLNQYIEETLSAAMTSENFKAANI